MNEFRKIVRYQLIGYSLSNVIMIGLYAVILILGITKTTTGVIIAVAIILGVTILLRFLPNTRSILLYWKIRTLEIKNPQEALGFVNQTMEKYKALLPSSKTNNPLKNVGSEFRLMRSNAYKEEQIRKTYQLCNHLALLLDTELQKD